MGERITYEYVVDTDGSISGWVNELPVSGNGRTREECCVDIIEGLYQLCAVYFEDLPDGEKRNPQWKKYLLKISGSTEAEIHSMLGCDEEACKGIEPPSKDAYVMTDELTGEYKFTRVKSEADGEIPAKLWEHILKHELKITQGEFNAGL